MEYYQDIILASGLSQSFEVGDLLLGRWLILLFPSKKPELRFLIPCLQRLPVTRALQQFFPHFKSFGGRQSNVSMTIVMLILCQFHGDVRSSLD